MTETHEATRCDRTGPKPVEVERSESEKRDVTLTVNGQERALRVHPLDRLLDVLRRSLGLTGTKEGCGEGECGACTVLIDGQPVNSCLVFAWQAEGHEVVTIEGLGGPAQDEVQRAFAESGAVQCGFCTPGMILTAHALLEREPDPTEETIRAALAGNLCRCTGYRKIVDAVLLAARWRRDAAQGG